MLTTTQASASAPILITAGEPAGIGPDCIALAWAAEGDAMHGTCICAPTAWLEERIHRLGLSISIREVTSPQGSDDALNCWNPLDAGTTIGPVTPGHSSARTASAVIDCIRCAAEACLAGQAKAMVTGPIEKAILRDSGFSFPGHTEFLARLAGNTPFVMMLASDTLRVALLTTHMAIAEVPGFLSVEHTLQCMRVVHHDLRNRFAIETPRIALCGLNPHAGEAGHFGREEIDILEPAAELARSEGIDVTNPLPADTLFSPAMRSRYDTVICCYHDQGLIPIKALSFGEAVNITLGLPFIRTSVDHGTAMERAGNGKVSYSSLVAAIGMAKTMRQGSVHAPE